MLSIKNILDYIKYFYQKIDTSFLNVFNIIFFILGIGFAKFIFSSIAPQSSVLNLPANSIILTVYFNTFAEFNKLKIQVKDKVYLVRKKFNTDKLFCRLNKNFIKILSLDNNKISLKVSANEINDILLLLKQHKQRKIPKIFIVPNIYARKLPLCSKQPRIVYATH